MKKTLRVLCWLLIAALVLAAAGAAAESEEQEPFKADGFTCILLEDGTAEIIKYSGSEKELEIPAELEGKTVTSIADKAFSDRSIKTVSLPDTITHIGQNPFAYCDNLQTITVAKDHPYLATVFGALYSKPDKRLICCPAGYTAAEYQIPQGVRIIGAYAFTRRSRLNSVVIPDSVTAIERYAFSECSGMKEITIPGSVTSIGEFAFSNSALTEAVIPEGVVSVGYRAFNSCSKLQRITFGDSVKELDGNPITGCKKLEEIVVSANHPYLEVRDGVLFTKEDRQLASFPFNSELTEYTVPEGIEIIGAGAFFGCSKLTDIRLPDSLKKIGKAAFFQCYGLASAAIPAGVAEIGETAYYECTSLAQLELPDALADIGSEAFKSCKSLENVRIPENVTTIGKNAFNGCSATFQVAWDSYAEAYCKNSGYKYVYSTSTDDLSWLED